jgi:hypothetical protein
MKTIALILTLAAVSAWLSGCEPSRAQERKVTQGVGKKMNEAQTRAIELLAIGEREFYSLGEEQTLALQSRIRALFGSGAPTAAPPGAAPLAPADAPLLAIGAPAKVDIARRSGIPVLIASRLNALRMWEAEFNQNTWIVAADLDSGGVTNGQPFIMGKREMVTLPSMGGPRPDSQDSATTYTSVRAIELREFCAIEWRPSRLAVTVVYFDRVSNSVRLELTGEEREPRHLPALSPTQFLTVSRPGAPAGLAGQGLAVSVPATVAPGQQVLIRAAVSIPARSAALRHAADGSSLLMASMLFLRKDARAMGRIDLALPAGLAGPAGPEQMVQSSFAFDARGQAGELDLAGSYQTYFVVGDRVGGPYPLEVKTP